MGEYHHWRNRAAMASRRRAILAIQYMEGLNQQLSELALADIRARYEEASEREGSAVRKLSLIASVEQDLAELLTASEPEF